MTFKITINRVLALIFSGIVFYMIYSIVAPLVSAKLYGYKGDWSKHKNYMWIFKDSARFEIENNIAYTFFKESDTYNTYRYYDQQYFNKGELMIVVWEFKNCENVDLNSINIIDAKVSDLQFENYETLNLNSEREVIINDKMTLRHGFNVKKSMYDSILAEYDEPHYKGVCGFFPRIVLSDKSNQNMIVFKNDNEYCLTSLLVYKKNDRIYILVVTSRDYFDPKVIDIFDFG
ncbi:MAG: hypothetical protein V4638_09315 [Bacteroidota bacterium]